MKVKVKLKVKLKEDIELYGRRFYAGQIIEVSQEIYKAHKNKMEKVEDADEV